MCDWEGCTTGTIRPPNPNQRRVAKTSGFPHPLYIIGTPRGGSPGRESWRSGDEGITPRGHRSRQGSELFSVHIEFWRSRGPRMGGLHALRVMEEKLRVRPLYIARLCTYGVIFTLQ